MEEKIASLIRSLYHLPSWSAEWSSRKTFCSAVYINSPDACKSVKYPPIGSDNGLSPICCQAIIWTSAGLLSARPLDTKNFSEMLFQIQIFSFKEMNSKLLSAKWWPFCLGLNVFILTMQNGYSDVTSMTSGFPSQRVSNGQCISNRSLDCFIFLQLF